MHNEKYADKDVTSLQLPSLGLTPLQLTRVLIITARQDRSDTELRSCAEVEVAVLGSPSLISLVISVDSSNAETEAAVAGLFIQDGSPTGQDMTKAYGPGPA